MVGCSLGRAIAPRHVVGLHHAPGAPAAQLRALTTPPPETAPTGFCSLLTQCWRLTGPDGCWMARGAGGTCSEQSGILWMAVLDLVGRRARLILKIERKLLCSQEPDSLPFEKRFCGINAGDRTLTPLI
jgi:hypothetical protein